jgi:Na+-driven multidrug efflux pump
MPFLLKINMLKYFSPKAQFVIPFTLFFVSLVVNISMPLYREYGNIAGLSHGELTLALVSYFLGMLPCYIFFEGEQRARAVLNYMLVGYIGFVVVPILICFLSDKLGIIHAFYTFEIIIIFMNIQLYMRFRKMKW